MALKSAIQIRGTAKHKGAKSQSYKKIDKKSKMKTKAKTVNLNVDKRAQRVAAAKATRTKTEVDRNRDADEAATPDTETIPES
jgi:hypothetical protein